MRGLKKSKAAGISGGLCHTDDRKRGRAKQPNVQKWCIIIDGSHPLTPETYFPSIYFRPRNAVRSVRPTICPFVRRPPEANGLCFCTVRILFPFFLYWLVYAVKVAGTVVHLGVGMVCLDGCEAPAGGFCANPVR